MKFQAMQHKLFAALLAVSLLATGCAATPSDSSSQSDSVGEVQIEDNIYGTIEELGPDAIPEPEISVTYEYETIDGQLVNGGQLMEFLNNFIDNCKNDPAKTQCSSAVQEKMKDNPDAAAALNEATPLYIQTQAEMDNKIFVRFAYSNGTEIVGDLFTFELIDGALQLTEPDRLALLVSGGVYSAE